jgi:hypothetical protein
MWAHRCLRDKNRRTAADAQRVEETFQARLALLWQIFSMTGFPNQFFDDSWVVGFWRADHEERIIGLGS